MKEKKLDEKTNLLPRVRPGVGDVPKGAPVLLLASASHGVLWMERGVVLWGGGRQGEWREKDRVS